MSLVKTMTNLGKNDARLISRDSFLLTMTAYIVGLAFLLRFGLPWLGSTLAASETIEFSLESIYPMLIAFVAVFNGSLIGGTVIGFLLLGEREDGTIRAMLVTPLPMPTYLTYRVILPVVAGFFLVTAQLLILNDLVALPFGQLLAIALGSSLTAPIASLFFATFAENKVQGFALMKFTGIGGFLIGGSWFIEEPIQYIFGLFPPYWISKAYWMALESNQLWIGALALGIVLQLLIISWLIGRFNATVYKDT